MHAFTLPENAKVFGALKPATDAAGRTGRYFNLASAHKAYFVFEVDQGNAATIAFDALQATSSGGGSAKAITGNRRIWTNLDEATNDTIARQTDAASFTSDAAVKEKLVIIEIDPSALDVVNGFTWVAARTGASNVGNLTSCTVYIAPRYQGASTGMPTFTA
jgi:hypothetical protein